MGPFRSKRMDAMFRIRWLLTILCLCCVPALSYAQQDPAAADTEDVSPESVEADDSVGTTGGLALDETVMWDVRGSDADFADRFRAGVKESLSDAAARHLLTEKAFRDWVAKQEPLAPRCFRGVTDCVAPGAIVFDALGLSSLVRVNLGPKSAAYRVLDTRGEAIREGEVSGDDPRKLGFAVVREIFDATGVLTVTSTPKGATVEIDGRSVGTTPLTYRVSVGEHRYVIRMPDHVPVEGSIAVPSGRGVSVQKNLALMPGTLVVVDAPEGAEVFVNGDLKGTVGAPIELEPGNYTLEIKAEGYEPVRDSVTVEAGRSIQRSAPLQQANPFLKDVSSDAIIFNNYILRLGFEGGFQRATFQDARSNDEESVEFIGFADENGMLPDDLVLENTLATTGFRLDAAYGLKNFGIVLLSMSYLSQKTDFDGFVSSRTTGEVPVTITSAKRLQARPFQIFYRQFYKNFVPFVEGGIGINFTWLQANGADFAGPKTLRRTDALWTLALGGQYYFTPNFFAFGRYSIQDYFERGLGTDHQLSLGVGAAFPNLFGFDTEPPDRL